MKQQYYKYLFKNIKGGEANTIIPYYQNKNKDTINSCWFNSINMMITSDFDLCNRVIKNLNYLKMHAIWKFTVDSIDKLITILQDGMMEGDKKNFDIQLPRFNPCVILFEIIYSFYTNYENNDAFEINELDNDQVGNLTLNQLNFLVKCVKKENPYIVDVEKFTNYYKNKKYFIFINHYKSICEISNGGSSALYLFFLVHNYDHIHLDIFNQYLFLFNEENNIEKNEKLINEISNNVKKNYKILSIGLTEKNKKSEHSHASSIIKYTEKNEPVDKFLSGMSIKKTDLHQDVWYYYSDSDSVIDNVVIFKKLDSKFNKKYNFNNFINDIERSIFNQSIGNDTVFIKTVVLKRQKRKIYDSAIVPLL